MATHRALVFTGQALVLAILIAAFYVFVARRPVDGWLVVLVVGPALTVPSIYLWRADRADRRGGGR